MIKTIAKSLKSPLFRKLMLRALLYAAAIIIPLMLPFFVVLFTEDTQGAEQKDLQVEVTKDSLEKDLANFMPRKVFHIGIHIEDIANIRVGEHLFDSRFVYWAKNMFDRSKNDRSQVEEDFIKVVNASGEFEAEPKITQYIGDEQDKFVSYASYDAGGSLKNDFFLSKYPFDKHVLRFIFEPKTATAEEMLLAIDPSSTLVNSSSLGTWKIRSFKGYSEVHTAKSDFSDPSTIKKGTLWTSMPRVVFEVEIERNLLSHLVKELFPLLLIMVIIYLNLFIAPDLFEIKTEVAVSAFLSITALHWVAGEELGNVSYLTAMDQFFLVSYGLVLLISIESIISEDLLPDEAPNRVEEAMRKPWFNIVLPALRVLFPLFLAATWYWIAFAAMS